LRWSTAFQKRSTTSGNASPSRLIQTSADFMPETAAHSAVASPSSSEPSPLARASSSVMRRRTRTSGTHPLLFLRLLHGGNQIVELPVQHLILAVRREVNAM